MQFYLTMVLPLKRVRLLRERHECLRILLSDSVCIIVNEFQFNKRIWWLALSFILSKTKSKSLKINITDVVYITFLTCPIFSGDPRQIDFQDFFHQPPITDTMAFFEHILLDFYGRSSLDDLQIRRLWSWDIFSESKLHKLAKINEHLYNQVENMGFLFRKKSALEIPLNLVEPPTSSNNLLIVLYFRLITLHCQTERHLEKNEDVMYLEEYSAAVCSGEARYLLKTYWNCLFHTAKH